MPNYKTSKCFAKSTEQGIQTTKIETNVHQYRNGEGRTQKQV
jgi:hypothetical protein